jgi:hypothetical protein
MANNFALVALGALAALCYVRDLQFVANVDAVAHEPASSKVVEPNAEPVAVEEQAATELEDEEDFLSRPAIRIEYCVS